MRRAGEMEGLTLTVAAATTTGGRTDGRTSVNEGQLSLTRWLAVDVFTRLTADCHHDDAIVAHCSLPICEHVRHPPLRPNPNPRVEGGFTLDTKLD